MQAYLVGGAVRDALLGRPVVDRDWVVVGQTAQAMLERGFRPVGRDFPVFLHPATNEEYALARTERKSGHGYHGFVFHADPSVTLEDDLRRRDLTINAIAQAPDGGLVDPFGGMHDLQARVLRHVSPAFVEDPLRVLRVARFVARFAPLGFRVADETLALMRAVAGAGELAHLVPERVWAETEKALREPRPGLFLRVLRETGALAVLLPEVDRLYGVPQRPEYHPEIDAGLHQEMVSDMAARLAPGDSQVGLAALLHDLGKGITPAEQWPRHIGHEHAGLPLVEAVCTRLKLPAEHAASARHACRHHLQVHRAAELKPGTVLSLFEAIDAFRRPDRLRVLLLACEADQRGRLGREESDYPQARYLRACFETARAVTATPFVARGLAGKAVGAAIQQARTAAIAHLREVHFKS
ncbi:MAG: multifunctional CCA addition/repair protein [Pseudomonadota bacterium]|jgi:tRNA nucleotidyltransferase (CCA-adding enzyme)